MPSPELRNQLASRVAPGPGLYHPCFERDACGVGFVATLDREPSRKVVSLGLQALGRLLHRGAVGADARTGDGAGIMIEVPDRFMRRAAGESGIALPPPGQFAVGGVFLPRHEADRRACEQALEAAVEAASMVFLGWRDVPCRPLAIGVVARSSQPAIRQCFVAPGAASTELLEDRLYPLRKRIEARVRELPLVDGRSRDLFSVVSLSSQTLVYKGQLTATQLSRFYPDLRAPDLQSRLAVFHQRFSTNTEPSWRLAQPFRFISHNGEINTVGGNRNWMRARAASWRHLICGVPADSILPVIEPGGSDSAAFDNTVELLVRSGRPLAQALMMMIPEAWEDTPEIADELRGFYSYHANLMEPWDGPAAIAFSDGRLVGAALDRNGLRPARYVVTRGGLVVLASEAGVVDVPAREVLELGRLHPGQMLAVDTREGLLLRDQEIKRAVAARGPWAAWERGRVLSLHTAEDGEEVVELPAPSLGDLAAQHRCFGYTEEELRTVLAPAATGGHEAVASMGNDAALAALSRRSRLLFDYFSQGFAQVTNPPIDSLRERRVMSLRATLGPGGDLLAPDPAVATRIELDSPILTDSSLARVRQRAESRLPTRTLAALFPASGAAGTLERALDRLSREAERAVRDGVAVLILSDRDVDSGHAPIPSLLALGRVHHHLLSLGQRTRLSLVVESAEPRTAHQLATLIGHGAEAVNPYLALATVAAMASEDELPEPRSRSAARTALTSMLEEGVLKVMSKMGISTLASYCGSQVFEAIGIAQEVMDWCFPGTPSRLGGAGFDSLAAEVLQRHRQAFPSPGAVVQLEAGGEHRWRADGEAHAWNPESVAALQHAVRDGVPQRFEDFRRLADADDGPPLALRHLLAPLPGDEIPIDQVEPATQIVRRFVTGAMSLGALSTEAHETLALAMNQIGGKSNTGEGGEDPSRYHSDGVGGSRRSAIKQVASGRFGVTLEYLVNADEIQIKMAQGAKPGEGGQLPGHKVDATIARLRHATPGVGLISPPPHHDIYSIEDLAELIWDLKQTNPRARISVKLVASTGVGTVAAGVVKARADHITISGHDGGTGAAPLTSIKHTGLPWELGLAETQQTLVRQGLRSRVVLQVDGGLRTGRDVVIAAMLGADEFGFATAALVASGCVLMRVCHLNTCPVGIATQDPLLRQRFAGTPEHVIRFFMMVAEDTRAWLARLGFRSLEELIGRVDRLGPRPAWDGGGNGDFDLSPLLAQPDPRTARLLRGRRRGDAAARRHLRDQEHHLERALDIRILSRLGSALETATPTTVRLAVSNRDRAVGTLLSGEITRVHGGSGLPDDTVRIHLLGIAGQSLGAWLCAGVTVRCVGAANDYPGKGLSGGRLVVLPAPALRAVASSQAIVGNVALYGATSGEAFFAGRAGERFAVRNSGAVAVVEGVGDHGCEYMTGGTVLVLGEVGRNFGAGMSGGVAYVLGARALAAHLNLGSVELQAPSSADLEEVLDLVEKHRAQTGSQLATELLRHPDRMAQSLQVVRPRRLEEVPQPMPELPDSEIEPTVARA
ncbi:MAG: glutamate synthase large subunit [Candidatus Dormibacteria bacterium]